MTYRFKALPELYWSVLTAAAVVLLLELAALNPDGIQNWRTWAVALGVAMVRAAAGAGLDWLRRQMAAEPEPAPASVTAPLPFAVMHRRCKGAAFLSLIAPVDGSRLYGEDLIHLNGKPMGAGEPSRCDSCAMPIGSPELVDGLWVAA